MEIIVNKNQFLKELSDAGKFRGKDGVMNNILVIANKENLTFKATDSEVYYQNVADLQIVGEEDLETVYTVKEEGQILIPSKFDQVFRKCPSKEVTLIAKDGIIKIVDEGINAKISTIVEDFPVAPSGQAAEPLAAPKEMFLTIVNKTAFAASDKENRPTLKALNMTVKDGLFVIVATDSHRLAKLTYQQNITLPELNIPAKRFSKVLDVFGDDEKIELTPFGSHVQLKQEEKTIFIRLIDGNYPDTTQLANILDTNTSIKIISKDFYNAIDRAVPFAKDEKGKPIITMQLLEDKIKVFSAAEDGSMESAVPFEFINKGEFSSSISFNALFLLDAIRAHSQEYITLSLEGAMRPAFILSNDKSNVQLVVPVRTS